MSSQPASQQPSPDAVTLRERQSLFVQCLGMLYRYAGEHGYDLTLGEGYIQSPRKARDGSLVQDGVHMPSSLHYTRLAQDLNLFVHGVYVVSGDDPAWRDLGEYWETLDPACRWGGRFQAGDANHFSIAFEGRA